MAASSLGLFFLDDRVASGLQLIRRLMQPQTLDVPHITLRYSDIEIPKSFQATLSSTRVDRVLLEAPGTFDVSGFGRHAVSTTFLSCRAPQLEAVSYKPDFPDSIFHVTLYEGRASHSAYELLQELRKFPWNLEYMPAEAIMMSFDTFRDLRADIREAPAALTYGAATMFRELTGRRPSIAALQSIPWASRLRLIVEVVQQISSSPNVRPSTSVAKQIQSREHLIFQGVHQAQLFSDADLGLDGTSHAKEPEETATVITPPEIAAEVVEQAVDHLLPSPSGISLLDPAIGGGVFFAALLAKARQLTPGSSGAVMRAVGIEKRAQRARQTQHVFEGSSLQVLVADFLAVSPSQIGVNPSDSATLPNLLLANPPYMRPSLDSSNAYDVARLRIRDRLGISLSKRANLYIYFILHADAFLAPGAVASWVLPREVLYSDAAEPVRKYLVSQVDLLSVHVYTDAMRFHRRRVSTVVITYRKDAPSSSGRVHWSQGDSMLQPERRRDVERELLKAEPKWDSTWLLGASMPRAVGVELGRLFTVTRGIATGANYVFVVDDDKRLALGLEEDHLRPLLPKPRELMGSVVGATPSGLPMGRPLRWLIDSSLPWGQLEREAPNIFRYLSKHAHVAELTLPSRRNPFYRQERQDVPPLVFISMTGNTRGGDRFILNTSRGLALNNYHVVRPNRLLEDWMRKSDVGMVEVHRALQEVKPEDLWSIGRIFHKGSVKLEPGDLRKLSLRSPLFLSAMSSATVWEEES